MARKQEIHQLSFGYTCVKKKAVIFRQQSFILFCNAMAVRSRRCLRFRSSARWRSMAILTYVECMAIGNAGIGAEHQYSSVSAQHHKI